MPDLALPDFLDFAREEPEALFEASASTAVADGGVLVFPDAVLVVAGERSDRIALDAIRGWSVDLEERSFSVTIRADRDRTARLPIAFLAPTANALEAVLGAPDGER